VDPQVTPTPLEHVHKYLLTKLPSTDVPTDYKQFVSGMKDPNVSQKIYDYLKSQPDLADLPKTYEDFMSESGLVEKKNPFGNALPENAGPTRAEAQAG
jgi:intergrase/recombinase